MSGGGGGSGETEVRYAPYIEARHSSFLGNLQTRVNVAEFDSPDYSSYKDIYIEVLYSQLFEDTINSPQVADLVAAEGALLDEEIEINSLPRMQIGMRDINSVMSSSFVIGKSLIEDARTKSIAKFSAELKYRLIPTVQDRWAKHLAWNQGIITTYVEIMRLYYTGKIDADEANFNYVEKDKLWPFTILEFERAGLGALQGATNTKITPPRASGLARGLSGAAAGAGIGAMIGVPGGAGIGAILGGIGGILDR